MIREIRKIPSTYFLLALFADAVPAADTIIVDDFESFSGWSTTRSAGAYLRLTQDQGREGKGVRIDYDFRGAGYATLRKHFEIDLPENYAFTFQIRAEAPANDLEFKLADPGGQSVWWNRRYDLALPKSWQQYRVKKRMLDFAWGPSGGAPLTAIGSIEIVLSSSKGGRGSIWLDDIRLEKREPEFAGPFRPKVTASTSRTGFRPEAAVDDAPETAWKSDAAVARQWLQLDFGMTREYGGLILDWDKDNFATAYQVELSADGKQWHTVYTVTAGNGGRDYLFLPDAESRYLRLMLRKSSRSRGYAIHAVTVQPFEFSSDPNQFFRAVACDAGRGAYPRYFQDEQSYFAVVGANGGARSEGLLSSDGTLEVDKGAFSIEPFLYANGRLITWNEVEPTQELEEDYLPIPSVTWRHGDLWLKTTAFADQGALYARYRVTHKGAKRLHPHLFLALRPFQVNPPWQSLNMVGGVTHIDRLRRAGRSIWVNEDKQVVPLTEPQGFGAAMFEQGTITDSLRGGKLPVDTAVVDPFGYASGALEYELDLPAGASREIFLAIPFKPSEGWRKTTPFKHDDASVRAGLSKLRAAWATRLARVEFDMPPEAGKFAEIFKSNLAWILINRDGDALQPGSRTYARTWIRDGAVTSSALLATGYVDEVRRFIGWYGGYQFEDGKIPCCVDWRGSDGVAENDSHGEFIYVIAEYFRYTRDIGLVRSMWPHIVKAVAYIESQRGLRLTEEYRKDGEKQVFYGLLPESISHEGYAARPVHAYWDDFWTLRGLKDAAFLAEQVNDGLRQHYAQLRDDFARDLYASIQNVMSRRNIAFIPASAELADFDPNAVAMFVGIGGEMAKLPQPALEKTFEEWWDYFQRRRDGKIDWSAYTPYEVRMVEALVRLGHRERALALLNYLLKGQRPAAWNQWAEVVWRDPKTPKFIGDMPHTWIGAEYIRALRSLFAYERESDQALVLAAGVPLEWVAGGHGVGVRRLPTWYGTLSYTVHRPTPREAHLDLAGDLRLPPGKIVVRAPAESPLKSVAINGKPTRAFTESEVLIDEVPAHVVMKY